MHVNIHSTAMHGCSETTLLERFVGHNSSTIYVICALLPAFHSRSPANTLLCNPSHLASCVFPSKPAQLYLSSTQCYTITMNFVSSFESLCPSQSGVRRLRAHPSFTSFLSKWSLPVYFQIRWATTWILKDSERKKQLNTSQDLRQLFIQRK